MIDSDSENSDASRSSAFPAGDSSFMNNSGWASNISGDQSGQGFNLQELDMMSAQQFQQQVSLRPLYL